MLMYPIYTYYPFIFLIVKVLKARLMRPYWPKHWCLVHIAILVLHLLTSGIFAEHFLSFGMKECLFVLLIMIMNVLFY